MTRLELHTLITTVVPGLPVYFQPPSTVIITYPCIVYKRLGGRSRFSGNSLYTFSQKYRLTLIDTKPDSLYFDNVLGLPRCSYQNYFTADGLHHDVFNIFA